MKVQIIAVGAALLSVLACTAPSGAAGSTVVGGIAWKAVPATGVVPHLRISRKASSSDVSLRRPEFGGALRALQAPVGPMAFAVRHEAGTLACSGRLKAAGEGEGLCDFTSDPAFETRLAKRGLMPDRRADLLTMLLVDATIELVDGLAREGMKPKDSDELVAAAALDVAPDYVRDLRSGALLLADLDDAIACKALGVDGAYVRGLAAAGYRKLSADAVVSMKATGVSRGYLRTMNRARGGGL